MSLLIVTGSHASGPQGEFGVWGSEKVYFQVKHDPWSQEPTELCCHSDWTGDPISLKNPKHKASGTFSFGTRFVICAPKQLFPDMATCLLYFNKHSTDCSEKGVSLSAFTNYSECKGLS